MSLQRRSSCLPSNGVGAWLPVCLLLSWKTEEAGPCFALCHPLDLLGVGEERGHSHGRKLNYQLRSSQLQKVGSKDGGCSLRESPQGLPCLCLRGCPSDPHGLPLQDSPCQPLRGSPLPLLSACWHLTEQGLYFPPLLLLPVLGKAPASAAWSGLRTEKSRTRHGVYAPWENPGRRVAEATMARLSYILAFVG